MKFGVDLDNICWEKLPYSQRPALGRSEAETGANTNTHNASINQTDFPMTKFGRTRGPYALAYPTVRTPKCVCYPIIFPDSIQGLRTPIYDAHINLFHPT